MPRGRPDDNVVPSQTAGTLVDNAEVAARTVGASLTDSLGRTILYDDFRDGDTRGKRILQGTVTTFPIVASTIREYLSTTAIVGAGFSSPYGLRMPLIGTTANTDKASLVHDLMLGQTSRLGVEAAVWIDAANTNDFELQIVYQRQGGTEYTATLYYGKSDQSFRLGNSSGTVVASLNSNTIAWVQVKLVADFQTGQYVRVVIGENRYTVSQALTVSAVVPDGECNFGFTAIGANPAATRPLVLGYILLTRDEP